MGEKLIEPKFNVNEKYRQVNILNPYRFGGTPPSGDYDADAQAFIDAVATLSVAQEEAIDALVKGLKSTDGRTETWSKYQAIYPFIGGTKSSHKWNLKNPLDTDAAFRLSFIGGDYQWVHDSLGAKNAANSVYSVWADTFYNPSINGTDNDMSLSFYGQQNSASNTDFMGYWGASRARIGVINTEIQHEIYLWNSRAVNNSGTTGWVVGSRTNSTDIRGFLNGGQDGIFTGLVQGAVPNGNLYLFGTNDGNDVGKNFTDVQFSFSTIGLGLTAQQVSDDYTVIQTYQTALGRNV